MTELLGESSLDLYVRTVEELTACSFTRSDVFKGCQLHFETTRTEKGVPLTITLTEPEPDSFRSYVMTLRQFTADREPTNFYYVSNLIMRGEFSDELKAATRSIRAAFVRAFDTPIFPFTIGKRPVTAKLARDLYFNSSYFHRDANKIAALESLRGSPAEPILRFIFLTTCINLFPPICNLGTILRNRGDRSFLNDFLAKLNSLPSS
jgi:hypothetical protein